jgi:dolichol-phosphate mannosyltransferase
MSELTCVVLPTYNEAENVAAMVHAIRTSLAASWPCRVIVVDDASPDGTGEIADRLAATDPVMRVLHRPRKEGLGPAYADGLAAALESGADFVVQMDCDFSHDPADLPRLLAAARNGANVVVGSRYVKGGGIDGWSAPRRRMSAFGSWYARRLLNVPVRDLTAGFKCFRAEALRALPYGQARSAGYAFHVEMTSRAVIAGLRVVEIPIIFRERRAGRSKMTPRIAMEAAWVVLLMAFADGVSLRRHCRRCSSWVRQRVAALRAG